MDMKRLRRIVNEDLKDIEGDVEVYIRNSRNPCGNVDSLDQVEVSKIGFFGHSIPCIILNTECSKELELDDDGNQLYEVLK